jgi:uncharacterized protein (DUF1800 family)
MAVFDSPLRPRFLSVVRDFSLSMEKDVEFISLGNRESVAIRPAGLGHVTGILLADGIC